MYHIFFTPTANVVYAYIYNLYSSLTHALIILYYGLVILLKVSPLYELYTKIFIPIRIAMFKLLLRIAFDTHYQFVRAKQSAAVSLSLVPPVNASCSGLPSYSALKDCLVFIAHMILLLSLASVCYNQ